MEPLAAEAGSLSLSSTSREADSLALCRDCKALPFNLLFTTPFLPQRPESLTFNVGHLKEICVRTTCPFCALVKHTLALHYGKEYVEAEIRKERGCRVTAIHSPIDLRYDSIRGPDSPGQELPFYVELHTAYPSLRRREKDTGDKYGASDISAKVQLIFGDGKRFESGTGELFGRVVDPNAIDWAYIDRWVTSCNARHVDSNEAVSRSDLRLLVIDVELAKVASLPAASEYVALSYMWGKDQRVKLKGANMELLFQPGSLNSPEMTPSRTIVHAMLVTRQLGFRYLWVDALCIIQDDTESILQNVGKMDQVYENASITIVAATGVDADSGLPGVANIVPRSRNQMRVCVGDNMMLANMLDSDSDAINFSRWNTRGWTYQERLLSNRCLTFMESQVYYECRQGCHWREDMHMDDGSAIMTMLDERYQLHFQEQNLFQIFGMGVEEYTKRLLTEPNDKIRAFQGLLNRLKEPFRGPFHHGIPTSAFVYGLLWIPLGAISRGSKCFPSWSWAGWDAPVRYGMDGDFINICECTVSQATIDTRGGIQIAENVDDPSSYNSAVWERRMDEDTLEIVYKRAGNAGPQPDIRYPRPFEAVETRHHETLENDTAGVLKIQGKTAVFRLMGQHTDMLVLRSRCASGVHELCHLSVFDEQNRVAGTVFVSGRLTAELSGKDHRFLALARSTMDRVDTDPSWDDDTQCFRSWNHVQSGIGEHSDSDDIFGIAGNKVNVNGWADFGHFNEFVFWPFLDVLLLSASQDGVVERLGIGKIHVDAFLPIAKEEVVLLG